MGQRTTLTTHDYLINAVLPEPTETYTVISHESIINKTKEALENRGFEIVHELYRCNQGAKIAQGVYHLKYGQDPDMGMMFAWSNSYDKSMRFKCAIGGYVHTSLSSVISHETVSTWDRKHTGNADQEAFDTIENQIANAEAYFSQLVRDKDIMKKVVITEQTRAELMGRIYLVHDLLTTEQLSTTKAQFNKPSFTCSGEKGSVWEMYNAIIIALQQAHPKNWMDQQKLIHWFLCSHFDVEAGALGFLHPEITNQETTVDPNQLNIIDEIAKTESEIVQPQNIAEKLREEADEALFDATADNKLNGFNNGRDATEGVGGLPPFSLLNTDPLPIGHEGPIAVIPTVDKPEGKVFYENADETIIVTRSEEDLNHELHGVDNTNIEVTITPVDTLANVIDEGSWECLRCSEMQKAEDPFHDGQLCTKCHEIQVENGELNQ